LRRGFLWRGGLCFVLLLGVVVYAGRLTPGSGTVVLDLTGASTASLSADTRAYLQRLDRPLTLTLFISPRDRMPSRLKSVEEEVVDLLEAMRRVEPGRIEFRVVDPTMGGAESIRYAASRRVSPLRVGDVESDEYGEAEVWSSLVLALEGFPEILIQGLENAHLPHLEGLVYQHLRALQHPVHPSFAVSAPAGFAELPRVLSQHGPVIEVDLERHAAIPMDVDLLVWIQPGVVTREHLQQLKNFVASGRSAVLAGTAYAVDYLEQDGGELAYRPSLEPSAWSDLLRPLGLRPVPDLLMDRNTGPAGIVTTRGESQDLDLPFHLRNLPAFRDFRRFRSPARGGLSFAAASALEVDERRVRQAGLHAEVVATTTEHAWVHSLADGVLGPADLVPDLTVPKQNLMVLLTPEDPWSGQILVLASPSLFGDGTIGLPGYGHTVLLRDLVRTFCDRERLVRMRVDRSGPQRLSDIGPLARSAWRGIVVFLVPLCLVGIGLWRFGRLSSGLARPRWLSLSRIRSRGRGAALVLLVIACLATGLLARMDRLAVDLTSDQVNTPSALTLRHLTDAGPDLRAELISSRRAAMPPALKHVEERVVGLFWRAGLEVDVVRPAQLSPGQLELLARRGLAPFEVRQVLRDTLMTTRVWSALRLHGHGRDAVVPRLDQNTVQHLDFLVSAALRRLQEGRSPVVSVISDLPRLSPAEALEDYQKKGLSAPQGTDVYGRAKELLSQYGYRIHHVNQRNPVLPPQSDAVLWFQPRRDATPLLLLLSEYLARGGRAVVALQHYNIQQRQYRGSGFQTVYWPQPQFQDFDRYLQLVGLEQVREVLMDRTRHHLQLDTQVNRTAVREYDPQEVALPFLIRSVAAQYSQGSPLTQNLGDLLFIWGNRFDWRAADLDAFALQPLITTSAQSWAYAWQGGWLPPEALAAPQTGMGPQPLALTLEGPFPPAEMSEDAEGHRSLVAREGDRGADRGWLCLVGSSEMFKNHRLHMPDFQHDQFLLNAVAGAALGPDLAALQSRHAQPRGFGFQSPATKAWWRTIVIAAGPLCVFLYGAVRLRRQRGRRSAR